MHILKRVACAWKGPRQLLAVRRESATNLLTAGSYSVWKLILRNTTDHWAILEVVFAEPFVLNNVVSWAQSDWTSKLRARPTGKQRNAVLPVACLRILHREAHSPLNSHTKCSTCKSQTGTFHMWYPPTLICLPEWFLKNYNC